MTRMQQFTALIQQWEQDALRAPDRPESHSVYLHNADPSHVLVVTEFPSREAAERFEQTGMIVRLHDDVIACTGEDPIASEGYDLYYRAGADGRRTVFGEER